MKILYSLILLSVVAVACSQNAAGVPDKKVVCYYANWSPYRQGNSKFSPNKIDPNLCTHLIYAFATFSPDLELKPSDSYQDIDKNGFQEFNNLKLVNTNLKTLISIGGTVEGSARFTRLAASQDKIDRFAKSVIDLLRKYNFDGINIDWQFPNLREGSSPDDYKNYVNLVKTLRTAFEAEATKTNRPRLIVTITAPSETDYIKLGYDLLNLQKYVDFINVVTYDYHLSYEGNVNHHAPLYPLLEETQENINKDLNADATIKYLLDKGVQPEKLNLGIPTYGRTYKLEDINVHNLRAPSRGLGESQGYISYSELCQKIRNENWTVVHVNKTAMGPYAYKGEKWVGYDDPESARYKGIYARKQGLGGIMYWTVDHDDFTGTCGGGSFPLIKAGREGVMGRVQF